MNNPAISNKRTQGKSLLKYREVEEDLKYKILLGQWKPGDQIPTEAVQCKIYNVSRITIRKAINELENAGYLTSQSGKGTFVTNWQDVPGEKTTIRSFTNEMRELGKTAITIHADILVTPADKILAAFLAIAPGDRIIQLHRVRAIEGGEIIAYSVNIFPFDNIFSIDPQDYYTSFYEYLGTLGIVFDYAKETLEAMLPPLEVAEKLQISTADPVLKSVKISQCTNKHFTEYNLCYYIGKKYTYFVKN